MSKEMHNPSPQIIFDPPSVFAYDAYGNQEVHASTSDQLFTGHLYHAQSGLYFAPYRAYDPKLGRWLSREPLGLDGPNLYHYVFNNPIGATDLNGLWTVNLGAGWSGGWGGIAGTASAGIVIDGSGSLGFYGSGTAGGGISIPVNGGFAGVLGAGTYGDIDSFGGCSVTVGGGGGAGYYVGGSYNTNGNGSNYEGSAGVGRGGGVYAGPTYTGVWNATDAVQRNIFEPLLDWYY